MKKIIATIIISLISTTSYADGHANSKLAAIQKSGESAMTRRCAVWVESRRASRELGKKEGRPMTGSEACAHAVEQPGRA